MQRPFLILCTCRPVPERHVERHFPSTGTVTGEATGAEIKLTGLRVVDIGREVGIAFAFGALVLYMRKSCHQTVKFLHADFNSTSRQ
jgi:hypothetical protein